MYFLTSPFGSFLNVLQNGDLHSKIADLETVINLLKDRLETTEEPLRQLCYIVKVSNYFDNIRATQMKQARDIVDINYTA